MTIISSECLDLEFTETKLVLVLESIKEPEWGNVRHDYSITRPIQVDDIECCAESHVPHEHNDEEAADCLDCFFRKSNEESRSIKQSQPI